MMVLTVLSCRETEPGFAYEGTPSLHFADKNSSLETITIGDPDRDVTVTYGTMSPVEGAHQVSLVVDPTSTAVEGVHYQIIKATDQITSGEVSGDFIIRLLAAGLTQDAETLVLKLSSPTLASASIKQTFTMSVAISCPVVNFTGSFLYSTGYWAAPGVNYQIEASTTPNQILVKGFWDDGSDMILNYNPATNVITIPSQYTGFDYQGDPAQPVFARPSTAAADVSMIDLCNRKVSLKINYWVPALNGTFGNHSEVFDGV